MPIFFNGWFGRIEGRRGFYYTGRRLAVDELGLEPWYELETARGEKPVMRVRVS